MVLGLVSTVTTVYNVVLLGLSQHYRQGVECGIGTSLNTLADSGRSVVWTSVNIYNRPVYKCGIGN